MFNKIRELFGNHSVDIDSNSTGAFVMFNKIRELLGNHSVDIDLNVLGGYSSKNLHITLFRNGRWYINVLSGYELDRGRVISTENYAERFDDVGLLYEIDKALTLDKMERL